MQIKIELSVRHDGIEVGEDGDRLRPEKFLGACGDNRSRGEANDGSAEVLKHRTHFGEPISFPIIDHYDGESVRGESRPKSQMRGSSYLGTQYLAESIGGGHDDVGLFSEPIRKEFLDYEILRQDWLATENRHAHLGGYLAICPAILSDDEHAKGMGFAQQGINQCGQERARAQRRCSLDENTIIALAKFFGYLGQDIFLILSEMRKSAVDLDSSNSR
ncbi:hypothetical protein HerbRD11066_31960 [Herbidospora sp. RD11066]